jgi:hypothetical protein
MSVAQAVELLSLGLGLHTAPDGPQQRLLARLARELECWPLALKLACAYLCGGYGLDDCVHSHARQLIMALACCECWKVRYTGFSAREFALANDCRQLPS